LSHVHQPVCSGKRRGYSACVVGQSIWGTWDCRPLILFSEMSRQNDAQSQRVSRNMLISCRTLMNSLAHNQFIHLYGQRGARLDRDQSVHSSTVKSRSLLVRNFSPLLFWAPETHLQVLEKIWVDRLVHVRPWAQFNDNLIAEWKEITIIVLFTLFCMNGLIG